MICRTCQSMPARRGSEYCGTCLRALAVDLADGITAYVSEPLGRGVIAGVELEESTLEYERRQRG